jgi:hypothetical protein
LIFSFLFLAVSLADDTIPSRSYTKSALSIGAGGSLNLLDTYISPLEYTAHFGHQVSASFETLHPLSWWHGRAMRQLLFEGTYASADNKAKEGSELYGMFRFAIGYHYTWQVHPKLMLMAGGMYDLNAGVIYQSRNTNNPAQAKIHTRLLASGTALYKTHIGRVPCVVRYQLDVPFIGLAFSPDYGQSYYEIFSLNQPRHNVCLIHPFNSPSWRHTVSGDFSFGHTTLRASFVFDAFQSKLNNLKTHIYSSNFMLGYVWYIRRLRPQERVQLPY